MALSKEDNDLLTRVENGAPMGEMIRQHYWLPAVPSIKLEADGGLLSSFEITFLFTDRGIH